MSGCSCHINPPCDDCSSKTYCAVCNKLDYMEDMLFENDEYVCPEHEGKEMLAIFGSERQNEALQSLLDKVNERIDNVVSALDNYREYKTGIEDLETDCMNLKDRIENLEGKFNELEKHFEISRSQSNDQYFHEQFLKSFERIKNLEVRISLQNDNQNRIEYLERKDKATGEVEAMLLNKIKDLETLFYDEKDKFRSGDKKPFKCPVCVGKGNITQEIEPKIYKFDSCHACQGKCIIWG